MLIGIIGAPNKGKSTLFSAMTMNDVAIADYPFTTITPNVGITYATTKCAHVELGVKCNARNSLCVNGTRMIPVNVIDVAGLVEGAHEGKGMGNQFLNDLAAADAFILVVDASGKTDPAGNKSTGSNPVDDVIMVKSELVQWLAGIIKKHWNTISKRKDGSEALYEVFAGFKATKEDIESAANTAGLSTNRPEWNDEGIERFSEELLNETKPILIAANKSDVHGAEENIALLEKEFGKEDVVPCSAAMELALRKAAKMHLIDYTPGAREFKWLDENESPERKEALEYMQVFLKEKGTNVQEIINRCVFDLLKNIAVYPVEDENKYSDHFGNILPDCILVHEGATAHDLAAKIHTEIADKMLYAIDPKTKKRLAKEHVLHNNDVLKIVSAAK
jgi:hypothetical protein